MIAVHLVYDLAELYSLIRTPYPPFFLIVKAWGGILFFLISGICVTLGQRCLRRGALVLGCAAVVNIVTALAGMPIRFGVLHALGSCMILWLLFHSLTQKELLFAALFLILTGTIFEEYTVTFPFLYPLGLTAAGFTSADFFPLFPYLGFFLAGAYLGRKFYPLRQSLLPRLSFSEPFSRLFCFCGRHSLLLYLIHQPVLLLLIEAAAFLGGAFHEI